MLKPRTRSIVWRKKSRKRKEFLPFNKDSGSTEFFWEACWVCMTTTFKKDPLCTWRRWDWQVIFKFSWKILLLEIRNSSKLVPRNRWKAWWPKSRTGLEFLPTSKDSSSTEEHSLTEWLFLTTTSEKNPLYFLTWGS
jgi:hypothetical protein